MNVTNGRLAPAPGTDGLVTRVAGAVLFVESRQPDDAVASLVGLVAQHDGPTPARGLSRRLAALIAEDDEGALPGFALVAASDGGTYVQVYGSVEVRLHNDSADDVLSGVGSFTGIDREFSGDLRSITVVPAGAPTPDAPLDLDLQRGTTFGRGFTLLVGEAPAGGDAEAMPLATDAALSAAAGASMAGAMSEEAQPDADESADSGATGSDGMEPADAWGSTPEPMADAMPSLDEAPSVDDEADAEPMADETPMADATEPVADAMPSVNDMPSVDEVAEVVTAEPEESEADQIAAMHIVSSPMPAEATPDSDDLGAGHGSLDPTQAWSPDDLDQGPTAEPESASEFTPAAQSSDEEVGWGMAEATPAPSLAKTDDAMGSDPLIGDGMNSDGMDNGGLDLDSESLLSPPSAAGPSADQPSWYVPPVGAEPEMAEGATDMMAPVEAASGTERQVEWDDLPVADEARDMAEPQPTEAATMAIPSSGQDVASPSAEAPSWGDAEPSMAPPAEANFTSQLLGALDDDEVEVREALPVEPDPAQLRQADASTTAEVQVQGVICSRGHFNDPRSRFCSSCGISMVQNTQVLTNGPRPPLGVMVFEDGATFSLSTDYVVGRQPDVHELVQQGIALPLPVDDPERSISRAHAELRLVEWDVHLVNLSGTNGSYVWDEHGQNWIPIPEGQSVVLTPGLRVALGRRSAVFESSLVR